MSETKDKAQASSQILVWPAGLAGIALALSLAYYKEPLAAWFSAKSSPSILIMDTARIVDAAAAQYGNTPNIDPATTIAKARELARSLSDEATQLSARGYIVISRSGVIAAPQGVDITDVIARKLNVDLSKSMVRQGDGLGMAH